ncbi:MAG: phosphoserine phosphatase SerB [Casimicrobiaceae bacterium]
MDLVIQSSDIGSEHIAAFAELTDASAIEVLEGGTQQAYRLRGVRRAEGLEAACERASCDCAFVPDDLARARVGLVAMDMDSTLITIECIDEIADRLGIKQEVAAITQRAMRGELDFAASLTQRVALLAGLAVTELQSVYDERLLLSPGAERMLAGFRAAGARTLLVSGGFTFFTERLRERLDLDDTLANVLDVADGKLTGKIVGPIVDAAAKAARVASHRARLPEGKLVVAIGDGANDLPMLAAADVSIAYRAKPVVRAHATYAINHGGLDAALNLFA